MGVDYTPGLSEQRRMLDRMEQVFNASRRLHVAAAYAKTSGTSQLVRLVMPRGSRVALDLGSEITYPLAVEQMEHAGVDVRVVPDGAISVSPVPPQALRD